MRLTLLRETWAAHPGAVAAHVRTHGDYVYAAVFFAGDAIPDGLDVWRPKASRGKRQPQPKRQPPTPLPSCVHLGRATAERVACVDGCAKVRLVVFECATHGRCTVARRGEGVTACCRDASGRVCTEQRL